MRQRHRVWRTGGNGGLPVDAADGGQDALHELVLGGDADVGSTRAGELGGEALNEVQPGAVFWSEGQFKAADKNHLQMIGFMESVY